MRTSPRYAVDRRDVHQLDVCPAWWIRLTDRAHRGRQRSRRGQPQPRHSARRCDGDCRSRWWARPGQRHGRAPAPLVPHSGCRLPARRGPPLLRSRTECCWRQHAPQRHQSRYDEDDASTAHGHVQAPQSHERQDRHEQADNQGTQDEDLVDAAAAAIRGGHVPTRMGEHRTQHDGREGTDDRPATSIADTRPRRRHHRSWSRNRAAATVWDRAASPWRP
jgi:hypothetical protein